MWVLWLVPLWMGWTRESWRGPVSWAVILWIINIVNALAGPARGMGRQISASGAARTAVSCLLGTYLCYGLGLGLRACSDAAANAVSRYRFRRAIKEIEKRRQ